MISIKDGTIDLDLLEVADIIDIDMLQNFLDNFSIGMNCAAVSVNRKGEEITKPSHYREFCKNYVHKSSIGDSRCAVCHNQMGVNAVQSGKPFIGNCHAGLIDFAAPIIVNGVHLGTVLGGQILDQPAPEDLIKKVAQEIRVNENELWESAQHIDIVERKNIEAAAEVLYIVTNTMAQNGYKSLEIQLVSKNLAENFLQISQTVDILAQSAQDITYNQHRLSKKIEKVNAVTKEIAEVLQSISNVADKTKLIGINASIEAARLGNDGRGFTVVAKEIQRLSESSKNTVKEISTLNTEINTKINDTMTEANNTLQLTEDQSAAMEELSATVQDSVNLAQRLRNLFEEK